MVIRVTLTRRRDPHSPIADGLEGWNDFSTLQEPAGDVIAHKVSSKQQVGEDYEVICPSILVICIDWASAI